MVRKNVVKLASNAPLDIIMCQGETARRNDEAYGSNLRSTSPELSFLLMMSDVKRYVAYIAKVPITALGSLTENLFRPKTRTEGIVR